MFDGSWNWDHMTVDEDVRKYLLKKVVEMLDRTGDYFGSLEFANRARKNLPENPEVLYQLVRTMRKPGMSERVRNELRAARGILTEEDYGELMMRLEN